MVEPCLKERTYRLALVSSGAIALGAYEAGVLAQLYHDLYVFNRRREGRVRILIDAVAGSSAGSLTGLVLAQAIALDHDPPCLAKQMWSAWVESADVLSLLTPFSSAAQAFFGNQCRERIAARTVPDLPGETEFNSSRIIAVWMTLTNLDGIPDLTSFPRAVDPQHSVNFYSLAYRDYAPYFICGRSLRAVTIPTEALSPPGLPWWMEQLHRERYQAPAAPEEPAHDWWWYSRPATWAEAREHAITSGSFPFAFQSRGVRRDLTLYPRYLAFKNDPDVQSHRPQGPLPDAGVFQCVDGGLFNNQPIGRAIDAVAYLERLDPSRVPEPTAGRHRIFLVIEPDPNTSKQVAALVSGGGAADPHGLPPSTLAGKIIAAYFNDALYNDFRQALATNEMLAALEGLTQGSPPALDLNAEQLASIKNAFGIGYKRIITLEHIPYRPVLVDRLAGDWAGHFGGFLQRNLRAADFQTGQYEARQWFLTWLQTNLPELAVGAAELDDGLAPPAGGYSPLGDPPDPQIQDTPLATMTWGQLGGGRKIAIILKSALRGGGSPAAGSGRWSWWKASCFCSRSWKSTG